MIRAATGHDGPSLASIYNPYITDLVTSFEYEAVDGAEMTRRVGTVTGRYPWLVYEHGGEILGYAYASRWKERVAYHYCAETTIYLRQGDEGRGIGTQLYTELLRILPAHDVKIAIGCIALPNDASVALHEKLGFEKVGHFPAVGFKFDRWIDIGYWRKAL
jgi:L-amino acid N-acyltransferase YncA